MNVLIVIAAGVGLALAMFLVPAVAISVATLAAICLFIGASAAVLACVVGVPAAE